MSETIHEVMTGIDQDMDPDRTGSLLRKLAKFSLVHFGLEEGMMRATGYPGMDPHRLNHQRITEQLNGLVARHGRGGLVQKRGALSFLHELHSAHVRTDDLRYGEWLDTTGKHMDNRES
jgi:hemerythrin-like metal-binding protein